MTYFTRIWGGPNSNLLMNSLNEIIYQAYPKLDNDYLIVRSLEEFISQLINSNPGVSNIDNELFWTKPVSELNIKLLLRSGNDGIFPDAFFASENLEASSPEITELLCSIIVQEIENNLQASIKTSIDETYTQKTFTIYIDEKIDIIDNFEKTQLGIFLYILYLKRIFANNPNVCVITSDLAPLFKRCRDLEQEMATLDRIQFLNKNPHYENRYRYLRNLYTRSKIYFFRIALLISLIDQAGPYVIGKQKDYKFEVEPSHSFKILFDRCKKSGARFSVSFVSVFNDIIDTKDTKDDKNKSVGHGTILIIDNIEKVIERFDPNGNGIVEELRYITDATDDTLGKFAKQQGYLYASPSTFCPRRGIQQIEHLFSDKTGYCVSWSILYGEERLMSGRSRGYMAENLLDDIIKKYNLKSNDDISTALNVEKWIRRRIDTIFGDMEEVYKELSSYLDIPVKYSEGKLIYYC